MKKFLRKLSVLFIVSGLLCSCNKINIETNYQSETEIISEPITETTKAPIPDSSVHVVAVGDNLIHRPIYNQANKRANYQGYDFDFAYDNVKPLIKRADLAIVNQETPLASDLYELSSYPRFNSPKEVGDKMIDLGFNAVSHSNNHILDKNEDGMIATLDYWHSKDMLVYGAYRNEEELHNIPTKTINGITFAFVGFMEHTNCLSLPKDSTARLVYTSDEDTMKEMINEADKIADVVIISVHWGIEITNTITDEQRELADKFVEWGGDLIIGTQPHAIQSMEYKERNDGSKAFVAYSLGNFISAQNTRNPMIGMILDLDILKSGETGKTEIKNINAIPIITHYGANYSNVQIYPYSMYTPELAAKHGINSVGKFDFKYIDKIINENIPKEFLKIE